MKVIEELIGYFEKRGRFTEEQMVKLFQDGFLGTDAPAQLSSSMCQTPGQTYYFRIEGDTNGTVWGTDIYTGDSYLAPAAVHAGAIKQGERGVIRVIVMAPLSEYKGSKRHGVTSYAYGSWGQAFRVERVGKFKDQSSGTGNKATKKKTGTTRPSRSRKSRVDSLDGQADQADQIV